VLLATVTAFPNDATRFLCRLEDWLQAKPTGSPDQMRWCWADLMPALEAGTGLPQDKPATKATNRRGAKRDSASMPAPEGPMPQQDMMETGGSWELLLQCLGEVTADGFQQPFSRRMVSKWAGRVARYSFSVQPLHGG
jgi:hypothetical protein